MSLNILLISETVLKERTAVHGNIDPKLLYPEIKAAQDMYIHPILGSALYNKLITLIETDAVIDPYKSLLDNYIIDPLLYYTLAELPQALSYQFWNKGVVRKQGDNTELPSMSELIDISNHHRKRAEWYGERLRKYLIQTSTESVLPEYRSPGDTIDTITPENTTFTMPIYLGDDYGCSHNLDKCNC